MSETTEAPAQVEQPDVIEFNGEVEALLAERAGYVLRGLDDRVAEVDEQLKVRGHKAKRASTSSSQSAPPADPPADPPKNGEPPVDPKPQENTTPEPTAKTAAQKRAQAAPKGAPKGRGQKPADTV